MTDPSKPTVETCGYCGYGMPSGTCERQGCRAARLYWAKRAAKERVA